jgi:hypothetical protein
LVTHLHHGLFGGQQGVLQRAHQGVVAGERGASAKRPAPELLLVQRNQSVGDARQDACVAPRLLEFIDALDLGHSDLPFRLPLDQGR